MPKASVAALVVEAISPKLHDKTLSAFVVPDGKPPETMSKSGARSRATLETLPHNAMRGLHF
jgi:hypothetical protein